jgi:DNA-binding transcriptional LysR family regulator
LPYAFNLDLIRACAVTQEGIMMNLGRLNIFLHVAKTLSFSAAAQQLHLSQPTVSKNISRLEKELQAELFYRDSSGVQLTEAGKTLIPWASKLIRDSIDLQNVMGAIDQEITGNLGFACSTTAGKYILPQLAARFREKNPGVRITITPCSQKSIDIKLLGEEADLGIASVEMSQEGLEYQYFFTDHINLLVPITHRWAKRTSVDIDELLGEPFLLREPTSGTRRILQAELAKHDIALEELNILLEVGNAEAIVYSIASGLGISFVSKMSSACARAWGSVVDIPVNGIKLQREIYIGRKTLGYPNRAKEAFWHFIQSAENIDLLQLTEQ